MDEPGDVPPGPNPIKDVTTYFNYLKSIGVEYVEPSASARKGSPADPRKAVKPPGPGSDFVEPSKSLTLEALSEEVANCTKCPLHETRANAVFGSGSRNAGIMFVGEAPGAEEDKQGLPFVGRSGKLLTKMINAIDFKREDVYIANVLKSRPPNNRDPGPDEIEACEPYLKLQIEIIKPLVICALGAHAAHTLLKTNTPIGKLRGKFHEYNSVPLLATYHPAFLLRNSAYKKESWKDLQLLRDEHKKIVSGK